MSDAHALHMRTLAALDDPFKDHPVSFTAASALGAWRGFLLRARDGDTFVCILDRGFDQSSRHAIRVGDYYAPELSTAEGPRYYTALRKFIGAPILITPRRRQDGGEAFTFDRLVADVRVPYRVGTTFRSDDLVALLRLDLGPHAGEKR